MTDERVERLVADWIRADKVGDVETRFEIEQALDSAGIVIAPGDAGVLWFRKEMVS